MSDTRPLFDQFPDLVDSIPLARFASLPTPLEESPALAKAFGAERLFVKRDDLSAEAYGGNKVRKLEFLLQAAKERGAKEVMTFGYAGSNHCTATAIHARAMGLRSISMLIPQIPTTYLRRNLLASHAAGAELNLYRSSRALKFNVPLKSTQHRWKTGRQPYVIPPGGSSALGTIGFVNAAFELKQQLDEQSLPEPDVIYLAFSSMGSTAGLCVGLQAAGMNTSVIGVQVVAEPDASKQAAARLAEKTAFPLRSAAPDFPEIDKTLPNLEVRTEFFGEQYAAFTREAVEAFETFRAALNLDPGLALDGTYSGKALAGLAAAGRAGRLKGKNVVFWNTFNSQPFWKTLEVKPADVARKIRSLITARLQESDRTT